VVRVARNSNAARRRTAWHLSRRSLLIALLNIDEVIQRHQAPATTTAAARTA